MVYEKDELDRVVHDICSGEGYIYESPSGKKFKLNLHPSDDSRKVRLAWSIGEFILPSTRQPDVFEEFYRQTGIDKSLIYNGLNGSSNFYKTKL